MEFIHFGRRMKIEKLFYEWCESEGVANKPNSMIVFLMEKGWLNGKKVIEDLADTPQTDRQRLEGKRWTDALTTEEKKCMLDALDMDDTPQTDCGWK